MKTIKLVATFVLGAGSGLLAGYLTAPRKGKETRGKIVDESKAYKEALEKAATQKLEEARQILNKTIEEKKNLGKQVLDKVAEKAMM